MIKSLLSYGIISGLIIILSIIATIEFDVPYQWLGYLIMLIAFSAIYIAIRQYRDESGSEGLGFMDGFKHGVGITVVASVVYVIGWEIYLALTDFVFVEEYTRMLIEERQTSGASDTEIAQLRQEMQRFEEQYSNLMFRVGITFLEIFPVGLLVSLVCAGLLRRPVKQDEE